MDLSVLESALSSIGDIGKKELTFEVGNTPITLRTLLPDEEIKIQKVSRGLLQSEDSEEEEPDQATVMAFLDEYRIRALSYSIIAVGDLNFRDSEFVYTGEILPNGTKIKVPKNEAVTGILKKFSRSILGLIFQKYSELTELAEVDAENAIDFEPTDPDSEIQRLQGRIEAIQASKISSDTSVKGLQGLASQRGAPTDAPVKTEPQTPQTAPEPIQPRNPVEPPTVKPPTVNPPVAQKLTKEEEAAAAPSSLVTGDMNEAIQEESARLQMERQRIRLRPPPHLQAQETAREVFQRDGQLDGKDVFRMPTQNLVLGHDSNATSQSDSVSTSNPNFKSSK